MSPAFLDTTNLLTTCVIIAMHFHASSPKSATFFPRYTYGRLPSKSFNCHTYEIIELQVLCLPHLQKKGKG